MGMASGSTARRGYGARHQRLRAWWAPHVAAGTVDCARCGERIEPSAEWHLDHDDEDRTKYIGPSHSWCNTSAGGRLGGRKKSGAGGSHDPLSINFSLSPELAWDAFVQAAPDWLAPLLVLDENSNPPLAVSPVHPDATGTYATQAIPWIEAAEGKTLRWWQRFALALKLQHDANGRLLKRLVVESAPRRAGKSVGLRGLALWRMQYGAELFGERQEIVHTGSDLAVCRKAQKEAWRWAEAHWGKKSVTRGNGKEAIEVPETGDVWYVRAQEATYGWDTTLGLVDEGWDVKPDTVSEGLEPSLMGRQSPQLVMTSTSHRRARSTMRSAMTAALTSSDPKTLLLWWGTLPGADLSDPETWRKASPYWDDDRHEFIAQMYAKAQAGEDDPEFDDPDPLRGFACQFANQWNLNEKRSTERGEPVVSEDDWSSLVYPVPGTDVAAVAVESWFDSSVSVAFAYRLDDQVLVSVQEAAGLTEAAEMVQQSGCRIVTVGASLLEDPAFKDVKADKGQTPVRTAVQEVARYLSEGVLLHDGGELLSEQVLAVRTMPGADGPRIVSNGRADALKAAVYAAAEARKPAKPALFVL